MQLSKAVVISLAVGLGGSLLLAAGFGISQTQLPRLVGKIVQTTGLAPAEPPPAKIPIESVPTIANYDFKLPFSNGAELHAIGVYEASSGAAGASRRGTVVVKVARTEKPLVLALTAHEPVRWKLVLASGVRLDAVILSGYYEQKVTGIPEGTRVLASSHERGNPDYFYFHNDDSAPMYESRYDRDRQQWVCSDRLAGSRSRYRRTLDRLREMTGLAPASVQGRYSGRLFEVGPALPRTLDGADDRECARPGIF